MSETESLLTIISESIEIALYEGPFPYERWLRTLGFDVIHVDGDEEFFEPGEFDLARWEPEIPRGFSLAWKYDNHDGWGAILVKPLTQVARMLMGPLPPMPESSVEEHRTHIRSFLASEEGDGSRRKNVDLKSLAEFVGCDVDDIVSIRVAKDNR